MVFWVPMSTGYRPVKKNWAPMGTGYRPEKKNFGTDGYRVPGKFSLMPTPELNIIYNKLSVILSSFDNFISMYF